MKDCYLKLKYKKTNKNMSQFIVSLMISQAILDLENKSKIVNPVNIYNKTPCYERSVKKTINTSYPKKQKNIKMGIINQPRLINH